MNTTNAEIALIASKGMEQVCGELSRQGLVDPEVIVRFVRAHSIILLEYEALTPQMKRQMAGASQQRGELMVVCLNPDWNNIDPPDTPPPGGGYSIEDLLGGGGDPI